ncbi:hypothetical protein RDI58_006172 [Solanum bulbocastanum]
MDFV